MQSADPRKRNDLADLGRLGVPPIGCVLVEPEVGAVGMAALQMFDRTAASSCPSHLVPCPVLPSKAPSEPAREGEATLSAANDGRYLLRVVAACQGHTRYDNDGNRLLATSAPGDDPEGPYTHEYHELSQRLTRLRTVRESDSEAIQSLHYHYDPVGNITDIRDTAQQTVYLGNAVVSAANSYAYDALYRLVEATGREHSSEGTAQRTHADMTGTAQPMTSEPSAMRLYTQQFVYDEVGNILEMKHIPSSGTGWTRYYQYDTAGNRLLATSAPGDDPEGPYTHEYDYDAHGNMVEMPHLSSMIWNHDDELQEVTAGSETVYFQYAGGNRSRKYVEKAGSITEERIYLGNFEIYRKRISGDIDIERESLHISDGMGRILLIETKTIDEGDPVTTPTGIWRYQLSNHIGSASTEITEDGDIINYEEYHPYGTTAYRAVDSSVDVSAKRYRYTGMERDEETGLSYHTARYYASWLGRWAAADPIGLAGGGNRYAYAGDNPISVVDLNGNDPPTFGQAQANFEAAQQEYAEAVQSGDDKAIDKAQQNLREAEQVRYQVIDHGRRQIAQGIRSSENAGEKALGEFKAKAKEFLTPDPCPGCDEELREFLQQHSGEPGFPDGPPQSGGITGEITDPMVKGAPQAFDKVGGAAFGGIGGKGPNPGQKALRAAKPRTTFKNLYPDDVPQPAVTLDRRHLFLPADDN